MSTFESNMHILTANDGYRFEVLEHGMVVSYDAPTEHIFKCRALRNYPNQTGFEIEKVIYNDPATIVFWADGTKTIVKCGEEDIYDYQTGLLMCIAKKVFGNKGKFNDILREWLPKDEEEFDIHEVAQKLFDDFDNRANAFMNMFIGGKTDA